MVLAGMASAAASSVALHDDTPRTSPPVSVAWRYCAVAAPSAGMTWPLAPSASTMTASRRPNFCWIAFLKVGIDARRKATTVRTTPISLA